jgi:hypothetical protein
MTPIKKQYNMLTNVNDHTGAAQLIIHKFGTEEEIKEIDDIAQKHKNRGYILESEIEVRSKLENKYLRLL